MANKHLKILKQGISAWNQWRKEKPHINPDLSREDLSSLNLFWTLLHEANLSQANLSRSDLYQATLTLSDLRYANLLRADLSGADLYWADLSHANLTLAELNRANLNGATLRGAELKWADLRAADLRGADLRHTHLNEADLSEANLHYANLEFANLSGAKLQHSNLDATNLSSANLANTVLKDANLSRSDLSGADLRGADLRGADLVSANLSRANLSAATLDKADFSYAQMSQTIFDNNDLSSVKGLDTVNHRGPSTVGFISLRQSKGAIPEKFLRGCGLSNWELEVVRLYRPGQSVDELTDLTYKVVELRSDPLIQFYSCFISYSHADKAFARRLHDTLQRRGIRCWLDEHQLLPGDKIYSEVDRGIRLWDKVLLCCSESALNSWWVDNEIDTAFEKEQALRRERGREVLALIPLNLDGHLFSAECTNSKAAQIRTRVVADFTGWETENQKFVKQFEILVKALRADAGRRRPPPKPKL